MLAGMHSILRIDEVKKQGASQGQRASKAADVSRVSRCGCTRRRASRAPRSRELPFRGRHSVEFARLNAQRSLGASRSFRFPHRQTAPRARSPPSAVLAPSARGSSTSSISKALLQAPESALLERLLTYGPREPAHAARIPRRRRTEVVVVPRLGTISPWSSKATDIAQMCGLVAVRRIERGRSF